MILSFLNCVLSFLHCVLTFLDCLRASVHRDEVITIGFVSLRKSYERWFFEPVIADSLILWERVCRFGLYGEAVELLVGKYRQLRSVHIF